MPDTAIPSHKTMAVSVGLSILILFFWIVQLATLSDLDSSDAAGNGLAQGFAALEIIALWILLAILTIVAAVKGAMPKLAVVAALILIPASGVAAMAALELLSQPETAPFLWPIVVPAVVPPLIVAFCFWTILPAMRTAISAGLASAIVWGATSLLCLSMLPMTQMRQAAVEQEAAQTAERDAAYARLPADAPLWELTPFLATPDDTKAGSILDRIRHRDQRQSEAETMLDRGDFPLQYLGSLDLDPTQALCDKARNLLRLRAQKLIPKSANARPYTDIAEDVAAALAAMDWLVGYGCSCDAESLLWESMAKTYRDPNFDVVSLAELRDPQKLGQVLREDPARFSMLSPKSHLKAWLKFADDKELRDRALAGARTLDTRNADAVDMLGGDEFTAHTLLRYLPSLDLEATAPLCTGALSEVHRQLAPIYRPKLDDPRPYQELLERLGNGETLSALIWLAGHGCDAEAELNEANNLVLTYQDSPDRAAMLASLAKLRRKP